MKRIRTYSNYLSESVRDLMKGKTEDEIFQISLGIIHESLEKAYKNGGSMCVFHLFDHKWSKYIGLTHFNENLYFYKDVIFELGRVPLTSDISIRKVDKIDKYKNNLEDLIKKIEDYKSK